MAWVTPKTDWYGYTDATGVYTGDRFNAADFNRIKNNLKYLRDLAIEIYPEFDINDLGSDRTYSDFGPYADEINDLEENLTTIDNGTLNKGYGDGQKTYYENGYFIDFNELNRLESATLDLYNRLQNQYYGRRMFTWKLGVPNDGYLHGM